MLFNLTQFFSAIFINCGCLCLLLLPGLLSHQITLSVIDTVPTCNDSCEGVRDRYILFSTINISYVQERFPYAEFFFEIKTRHKRTMYPLCSAFIEESLLRQYDRNCFFRSTNEHGVYEVYTNMSTLEINSPVLIRVRLRNMYNEHEVLSEFHSIPKSSKAYDLKCTQRLDNSEDSITIDCTASRVFPPAVCLLSTKLHAKEEIAYIHIKTSTNPVYFNTTCIISIPTSKLRCGRLNVTVNMFPNLTDSDFDHDLGVQSFLEVNIEKDRFNVTVKNCPAVVVEETRFSCLCHPSGCDFHPSSVHWYNISDNMLMKIPSRHLNFTADVFNKAFRCQGTQRNGHILYVDYIPKILFFPIYIKMITNDFINSSVVVDEHGQLHIVCAASNYSMTYLKLTKADVMLTSARDADIRYLKSTVTCHDTGIYKCEATRYDRVAEISTFVYVQCSPRLLTTDREVHSVLAKTGQKLFLNLKILSHPEPNGYKLMRNGSCVCSLNGASSQDNCTDGIDVHYHKDSLMSGTVNISLTVNKITDFTVYQLVIRNTLPQHLTVNFTIVEVERLPSILHQL